MNQDFYKIFYFVYCLIDIGLNISLSYFQTNIETMMFYYGFVSLINFLFYIPKDVILHKIAGYESIEYLNKQYNKYIYLDQVSKEADTIDVFRSKVNFGNLIAYNNITCGYQIIMSILSTTISLSYILYKYNYISLLFIFLFSNMIWYKIVTTKLLNYNDDLNKYHKKIIDSNNILLNLYFLRLQNNDLNTKQIIDLQKKTQNSNNILKYNLDLACSIQHIPTYIIIMSIPFIIKSTELYPIMLLVCRNIIDTVFSISNFLNHTRSIIRDYKHIDEFWSTKNFNKPIKQIDIPNILSFNVNIKNLINECNLVIRQGDHILISGVSGSGKTTLIRSILGYIKGVQYYNLDNPLAYADQIVYMKQSFRETIPVSKITIRQIFYDEVDYKHILEVLQIVRLTNWFENVMISDYDKEIDNKISGGEKTRLCLALSLYKVIKNNAKLLILDEPEQGIDLNLLSELLYEMMIPGLTVLMITHLCDCQMKKLKIIKEWKITDKNIIVLDK